MPGEDSAEHETNDGDLGSQDMPQQAEGPAAEAEGEPGEAEPQAEIDRDTLADWPADALPAEAPPEAEWTPGGALSYARPRNELLPGQRRPSKVSPVVGTIAMWMGIGSAASLGGTAAVAVLAGAAGRPPALLYFAAILSLIGIATFWGAIILGTIGRLNGSGRRHATIGRRIGCAIPMVFLGFAVVGALFGSSADGLAAIASFLFALIVGNLVLLAIDGILGTS
jgi:hypothetical protein